MYNLYRETFVFAQPCGSGGRNCLKLMVVVGGVKVNG